MKHIQTFLKRSFIFLIATFCCLHSAKAQDSKKSKDSLKAASVKMMIESKVYNFNVQSVTPMKGGVRQLSPGYKLYISADTVSADLPYFGRLYQASLASTEGGLRFTSTNIEYSIHNRKKGGWEISIKPKDVQNVQEMQLTVFDNGSATMYVNSNDRQPISYSGNIEAKK